MIIEQSLTLPAVSYIRWKKLLTLLPLAYILRSRFNPFAYIGTNGEEQGRLIFYNLTEEKKTLLTPANLTVTW